MKWIPWRRWLGCVAVAGIPGLAAVAADAEFLGVVKGVGHRQTGPDAVVLQESAYRFNAFVDSAGPGRVLEASVTPPGKSAVPLAPDGDVGWDLSTGYPGPSLLDASFPNGSFVVRVRGQSDDVRTVTLHLNGDSYPPVPVVGSYEQLQAVNPGASLTLTWQPFTGGLSSDFIQVELAVEGPGRQTVFETAAPGLPGSLDGTRTSVVVPAGTLQPGTSYVGRLFFGRILGFNLDYGPETPAVTGYFRETEFNVRTAGADTEPPVLAEHSPGEWHGPVPRQSGVAFVFSEPMRPGHSVAWTGINPASITYRWTSDGTILHCLPAEPLPPDAEIAWRLDPTGFRDLAGNTLQGGAAGRFRTASPDPAGVRDIEMVGMYRAEFFQQSPGQAPVRPPSGGYAAAVFADSTGFNTLLEGSLTTPDAETFPLPYSLGDALEIEEEFDSPEALADAAPAGTYGITLVTAHEGTRSVTVQAGDPVFPTIPEVLGLGDLQALDPSEPTVLRWVPFVGGGAGDFIRVQVSLDTGSDDGWDVFESPEFPDPGYLDGTRTSVVIPAGTLEPGRRYRAELEFARLALNDTQTLPGSRIVVAAVRATEVPLGTAGTLFRPEIQLRSAPAGQLSMSVLAPMGMDWLLEGSGNPAGPWVPVMQFRSGPAPWEFSEDTGRDLRFYRVRQLP